MAKAEITVSIERAIHDAIADIAQRTFDEYGIKLKSVNIDWIDDGSMIEPKILVSAVHLLTETRR